MNRTILTWLASVVLLGGTALAQTSPGAGQGTGTSGTTTGGSKAHKGTHGEAGGTGSQTGGGQMGGMGQGEAGAPAIEPKKHLTEIDIYLRDAIQNTRALYQMSQWPAGKLDRVIEREGLQNLDKSIGGALTHIGHIQSLPEARISDAQDLSQLHNDLTQARTIVSQLRRTAAGTGPVDRAQLQQLAAQLYTTLQTADSNYGKVADATDTMRIDRVTVPERQPVRGGQPGGEIPSPGSSVPGGIQEPGGTQRGGSTGGGSMGGGSMGGGSQQQPGGAGGGGPR